jgi:hypothetical protein
MLIIDLCVAFGAAFAVSSCRPRWRQMFGGDWYPLLLRVAGIFMLYPTFEVVHSELEMEESIMRRFVAFFLSAGAIGAGAVASRAVVREL